MLQSNNIHALVVVARYVIDTQIVVIRAGSLLLHKGVLTSAIVYRSVSRYGYCVDRTVRPVS